MSVISGALASPISLFISHLIVPVTHLNRSMEPPRFPARSHLHKAPFFTFQSGSKRTIGDQTTAAKKLLVRLFSKMQRPAVEAELDSARGLAPTNLAGRQTIPEPRNKVFHSQFLNDLGALWKAWLECKRWMELRRLRRRQRQRENVGPERR